MDYYEIIETINLEYYPTMTVTEITDLITKRVSDEIYGTDSKVIIVLDLNEDEGRLTIKRHYYGERKYLKMYLEYQHLLTSLDINCPYEQYQIIKNEKEKLEKAKNERVKFNISTINSILSK